MKDRLWGPARKAINIFMTMALLNRFMCPEYQLERLEDEMEVPLDGRVHGEFVKWRKQKDSVGSGRYFSIKGLEKKESDDYQRLAQEKATEEAVPRGLLDVLLWP